MYEKSVNSISDKIDDTITSTGAVDYFSNFLDDLGLDEGLKATKAYGRIKRFVDKVIEEGDTLKFKDLNKLRIAQTTGKTFKADIDDVVYTQFRQSFNKFAETVDPTGAFKKLNAKMAPQLEFKHNFVIKTATYKQYETGGAERLVSKYANRANDPSGITKGEIELMDDAMKYLGKYGIKTKDIDNIFKGAEVSKSVSKKIARLEDVASTESKLAQAVKKNIRTTQDIKLGDIAKTKAQRLVFNVANTVLRLSMASYALNTIKDIRKTIGMGGSDSSNQTDN
jgi:hypothetical protein